MNFYWRLLSSVIDSQNRSKVQRTHEKVQILFYDKMQYDKQVEKLKAHTGVTALNKEEKI